KGISKKILHYHGIHVPNFVVIPRGQRVGRPKQLKFPILVKPVKEEASYGISQASFVETDEQFRERVAFVHEKYASDAIAEEYIEGRELYVGLMGNVRLTADNEAYFIEAHPNPILAEDEDFALSAGKAGLPYPQLINRITRQGIKTVPD